MLKKNARGHARSGEARRAGQNVRIGYHQRLFARRFARYRGSTHEYRWVLNDYDPVNRIEYCIDPRSREGRKAIARFHSDVTETLRSSAPRFYRKWYDRSIKTFNKRMLRRWLADPGYDPVFTAWHRHNANWSWW